MPAIPKVFLLPDELQAQLDQRLRDSHFGDYVKHSEWLLKQGYEVGKSAIHLYAARNRERIQAAIVTGPLEQAASEERAADQRIACLKIAQTLDPGIRQAGELCEVASNLFQWAKRPS